MTQDPSTPADHDHALRVGFISAQPISNPNFLSGMPYHMSQALLRQGLQIIPLCERADTPDPLPQRLLRRLNWERRKRTPPPVRKLLDNTLPQRVRSNLLKQVTRRSRTIQSRLDALSEPSTRPDILFGCCVSSTLYALHTDLPIVYFSDATSFILRDTYPALSKRGPAHIQTLHDIERTSVDRASAAIFASPVVRDSAVHDLRIDPDRTHVVPMGANVTPDQPELVHAPAAAPTRDDCQLLIIAADPIRKRVDLALEATESLRARGINATLHIVGPGTQRSSTSPAAQPVGRLKLSDPTERQTHQKLLRDCHIQLLPSLGEAFGIAPIESAHFARPAIVARAGGLSFVVQHDQTGLVIDPDADATAWADAIESLINDPTRYQRLSEAALHRARAELNWDAWGAAVTRIIRDTLAKQH